MTTYATRIAKLSRLQRAMLFGLGGLAVVGVVERIADASELTSRGTSAAALRLAVPIMLAGLGAIFSERSGVVNIGLEGMMIVGTWFGAWGAWRFGPWWGVLLGILGGALAGLIHAVATVTFRVDHIVSGVAINILAGGSMRFLSSVVYTPETGGSVIQSPSVALISTVSVPFLAGGHLFGWKSPDLLGSLENKGWYLVSDLAGVLRGFTGDLSWLGVLAFALIPLSIFVLRRTRWGLRLRSCGENPYAAESLGVRVYAMKYQGVLLSGALAGFGGAFLVLVQSGLYREGMTGGRGFIGLAALIFGNWWPLGLAAGAMLFGFGDSLRFRDPIVARALLLVIAIGLALLAVQAFASRKQLTGLVRAGVAVLFLVGYLTVTQVPNQFLFITPYLITLLVLAFASQRLRPPAADGLRYQKGEAV